MRLRMSLRLVSACVYIALLFSCSGRPTGADDTLIEVDSAVISAPTTPVDYDALGRALLDSVLQITGTDFERGTSISGLASGQAQMRIERNGNRTYVIVAYGYYLPSGFESAQEEGYLTNFRVSLNGPKNTKVIEAYWNNLDPIAGDGYFILTSYKDDEPKTIIAEINSKAGGNWRHASYVELDDNQYAMYLALMGSNSDSVSDQLNNGDTMVYRGILDTIKDPCLQELWSVILSRYTNTNYYSDIRFDLEQQGESSRLIVNGRTNDSDVRYLESISIPKLVSEYEGYRLYITHTEGGGEGGNVAFKQVYRLDVSGSSCAVHEMPDGINCEGQSWEIVGVENDSDGLWLRLNGYVAGDARCCPTKHARALVFVRPGFEWEVLRLHLIQDTVNSKLNMTNPRTQVATESLTLHD